MGQRMIRRQVNEGLDLYAEKNYDAAIKKWTISLQSYALLVMSDSYIGLCNFPKVLECLDKALSISHENEDHLMEIQVLSTMGKVYLALKDFSKALAFQHRAYEIALSNAAYTNE